MNKKLPEWLKTSYDSEAVNEVNDLMFNLKLNTVCKEASCPNLGECYKKSTATFMILGSVCTRNCRFCNVSGGHVERVDKEEPRNLAEAVKELQLNHVVITSVTRDDLQDGGGRHFANTIHEVRKLNPKTTIEVLIPDLKGQTDNLDIVINAKPDVINHNVETVKNLYARVRPEAFYNRSLFVLKYVKDNAPNILTKTGIMVGLGERTEEVYEFMDDCVDVGCDILTIGQYLRPSKSHIEVAEYITPEMFLEYKEKALEKGFKYVASAPLVRSSYKAEDALIARSR